MAITLLATVALAAPPRLQTVLEQIRDEARWRSPGTELGMAVHHLGTGEQASLHGDIPHVSASAFKPMWTAAALHHVGLERVAPFAEAVFVYSDNHAAGQVIDLIGPEVVNRYLWEVAGMKGSALTRWRYGRPNRIARSSPRRLGSDNYFTAADVVRFLVALEQRRLLPGKTGEALRTWMTLSPRDGLGGWLGTRLPASTHKTMLQKAGWLGPGCCSSDRRYNVLTTLGVVETPRGRYAVALFARHGKDFWTRQVKLVEWGSCLIYRAAAEQAALSCDRPGDPRPSRAR